MLKTKYIFLKKMYPFDVILFIKNNKYITYGYDSYILKYVNYKNKINILDSYHINYIIIDNLTIINRSIFDDNKYLEFLYKQLLIDAIIENVNIF